MEESFNLQASHDLFYYGLGPAWKSSSSWHHDQGQDVVGGGDGDGDDDDDVLHSSSEGANGDRGQSESCQSKLGGDLPYDHLQFPGGGCVNLCL